MLLPVAIFLSFVNVISNLQLNLYTSIGQIKQEIPLKNGSFQTMFTSREYQSIVPGTLDFPGQRIVEQDFYNSNEQLRQSDVFVRSKMCADDEVIRGKLVDPHSFLIRYDSSRYSYVSRDQLEFNRDPTFDGMILSVQFDDKISTRTTMTYLTRGLSWTPRYEVLVIDDYSATLRALADISNEHERSYTVSQSQLITGTVPLVTYAIRLPSSAEGQRAEYMSSSTGDSSIPISSQRDSTNFGSYSYNITRPFQLLPKSIKTFPFLTMNIICNYSLETSIYLTTGSSSGLFQRIFTIQPSEFLPAGTMTFYLANTGITLGQGRLADTPAKSEQKINLANDPDVKYTMVSVITATRQTPVYGQDLNVNITIANRKENQRVNATLSINSGYRNTTLIVRTRSSANINISQDPNNRSLLIVRAIIKENQEETCSCTVKQSN